MKTFQSLESETKTAEMRSSIATRMKWISAASSSFFLVLVFISVSVQIIARAAGMIVPSADDFARYAMAISAFHGLSYAYWDGAHVRVTLFISNLSANASHFLALVTVLVSALTVGFLTFQWGAMTFESFEYGSRSAGLLAIPNWLIQLIALLGLVIFWFSVLIDMWMIAFKKCYHAHKDGTEHG